MGKPYLKKKIKTGLDDQKIRAARLRALGVIKPGMLRMVGYFPDLSARLRRIKEYSIHNLPVLLEQTVHSLEKQGCRVFIANTSAEAILYIEKIAKRKLAVKSKSNAGKEIGLTEHLEKRGNARVIETDLGDRINQLAKSSASHSLAPAIHIPIEKVAELFSREAKQRLACDLETLVQAARHNLRGCLEEADVGIAGVNAVAAETGSLVFTENEGNIRAVASMPKVFIAIAGIEKIVPTLPDSIQVARAGAVYGTGADLGTYISVISGPARYRADSLDFLGSGQGPDEVHVVFLAGGRDKAVREGFAEALFCINCGSCLNFCPIYREIGEKYGYKYLGGRGAVFTAFHDSLKKAQEAGLSLCIGCGKCLESCPVGMDIPEMVFRLRAKVVERAGPAWIRKKMFNILAENKLPRYLKMARAFRETGMKRQPGGRSGTVRIGLPGLGIPAERVVPLVADRFLEEIIKGRPPVKAPQMRVSFFAGCAVKYFLPHLGADLLDVLEAQGIEVVIHEAESCCGRPLLISGARAQAADLALRNVELLTADETSHLVFLCPSCAAAAKKEWPRLLENEGDEIKQKSRELAAKVMDISQFCADVTGLEIPLETSCKKVTYHDSCSLSRGLGVRRQPRSILQAVRGVELVEMEEADSCCGFGGSFSFSYYNLAGRIGAEKAAKVIATGADCVVTGCPGCMIHLADSLHQAGGGQKVVHTVELLAEAVRGGKK